MSNFTESKILEENARFLGIDLLAFFDESAKKISNHIINSFNFKTVSIICGGGGNGADGLAIANYLAENNFHVNVYLVGRTKSIESDVALRIWNYLLETSKENSFLKLGQDCFAEDIEQTDLTIECLTGTGLKGEKLNKRFADVVKRISHFNSKIVAIDIPSPHYKPDLTISLDFAKTEDAEVIKIQYPRQLELYCGPGEKSALWKPNTKSHKTKNGKLLVLTSNEINDLIYSTAKEYSTNVDVFNFNSSDKENGNGKSISAKDLESLIAKADTILLKNIEENILTYATINQIIKSSPDKSFVISGEILKMIELENLRNAANILLLISSKDLSAITGNSKVSAEGKLKRFCIENQVNLILFGLNTMLFSKNGEFKSVRTASNSFDKTLANVAVYSTKNDLWLSARASFN